MNRLGNIISVVTGATVEPQRFATLPMSAQVKVAMSCMQRITGGLNWWNDVLAESPESKQVFNDTMKKRAINEINARLTAQHSLCDFIGRAAECSGSRAVDVLTASGHLSIDKAPADSYIENDEFQYESTAVNTRPFAWAKEALESDGKFPTDWDIDNEPVDPMLWEVNKTYDKYGARYFALTVLAEAGLYKPPVRKDDDGPGDVVMIASCSKQLAEVASAKSKALLVRGLKAMLRQNFSENTNSKMPDSNKITVSQYIDGQRVDKKYGATELVALMDDMIQLDIEDAEAQAEKDRDEAAAKETKAMKAEIKSFVRSAILTTTIMGEMTKAAKAMTDAGVDPGVIAGMVKEVTSKLCKEPETTT